MCVELRPETVETVPKGKESLCPPGLSHGVNESRLLCQIQTALGTMFLTSQNGVVQYQAC